MCHGRYRPYLYHGLPYSRNPFTQIGLPHLSFREVSGWLVIHRVGFFPRNGHHPGTHPSQRTATSPTETKALPLDKTAAPENIIWTIIISSLTSDDSSKNNDIQQKVEIKASLEIEEEKECDLELQCSSSTDVGKREPESLNVRL